MQGFPILYLQGMRIMDNDVPTSWLLLYCNGTMYRALALLLDVEGFVILWRVLWQSAVSLLCSRWG